MLAVERTNSPCLVSRRGERVRRRAAARTTQPPARTSRVIVAREARERKIARRDYSRQPRSADDFDRQDRDVDGANIGDYRSLRERLLRF